MKCKLLYAFALLTLAHQLTAYDYKVRNDTNTDLVTTIDITGDERNWAVPAHGESGLMRKKLSACLSRVFIKRPTDAQRFQINHEESYQTCGSLRIIIKYGVSFSKGTPHYYFTTENLY
ncbi:MAG: hypothetical protein WCE21_04215 [Candidatus Babeliales bacterium]